MVFCVCYVSDLRPTMRPPSSAERTDRIGPAGGNSEHQVKAKLLVPLLNSYFYHRSYTIHGGRGFESDELHESVGVFGAVQQHPNPIPPEDTLGAQGPSDSTRHLSTFTNVPSAHQVADHF